MSDYQAYDILRDAQIEFGTDQPWCHEEKGRGYWNCIVTVDIEHENGLKLKNIPMLASSGYNSVDAGAKAGALAAMFDIMFNRPGRDQFNRPMGRDGTFVSFVEIWKLDEAVNRWLAKRGQA